MDWGWVGIPRCIYKLYDEDKDRGLTGGLKIRYSCGSRFRLKFESGFWYDVCAWKRLFDFSIGIDILGILDIVFVLLRLWRMGMGWGSKLGSAGGSRIGVGFDTLGSFTLFSNFFSNVVRRTKMMLQRLSASRRRHSLLSRKSSLGEYEDSRTD